MSTGRSPGFALAGTRALLFAVAACVAAGVAEPAEAQWVRVHEQYYLPASHNWVFRDHYAAADRLFNAFDYGHAILYEELYRRPEGPVERLEVEQYEFLTEGLLRRPPRVPLEEGAIEVAYAKLAPEAKAMFHWAHILHRQLYDVLADERLDEAGKDAAVAEVVAYYRSRPDVAFSSVPKSMDVMDGQYYSLAFRERYPKFNGLIWAYHWLQVGLYEPLLVHDAAASRTAGVKATVGRFWQMLEDAPETMPYLMPMTAGVAPTFSSRYTEAAIIFDNLHMMHDVISDILASPAVPRERKRAEILRAVDVFRDDTTFAIPVAEWLAMGDVMGVHNMGGVAVGFLDDLPTPTVPRGMSMAGMEHGAAMDHEAAGHEPAGHEAEHPAGHAPAGDTARPPMAHHPADAEVMGEDADTPAMRAALELLVRMLAEPEVEARVHASPRLHELWSDPAVQRLLERARAGAGDAGRAGARPHRH